MNKSFLKILTFSLLSFIMLMGCAALEDKPVPDPKKFDGTINNPITSDNPISYIGTYNVAGLGINPTPTELYVSYLLGNININTSKNGGFEFNYGLKYSGYNNANDTFMKNHQYEPINGNVTVDSDNYTIRLDTPISITNGSNTYTISALRKQSDSVLDIKESSTETEIIKEAKLCDPKIEDNKNSNSCTSPDGAMKYIGYYRIEEITCNSQKYTGGTDFAGEMTAAPSTWFNENNILMVDIPIKIKMQAKNQNLKSCFFKSSSNTDLYLNEIKYQIDTSKMAGGLVGVFTQVGLNGLKDESDETIRTTQINYLPKDSTFNDLKFGDGNNAVTMRLKIISNSELNLPANKTLDDTPYFQ